MSGKKILNQLKQTVMHPTKHPVKLVALGVGTYLLVDYLVAKKGDSSIAKLANAVVPSAHARPARPALPVAARTPAPPGGPAAAQAAAVKGYYTGSPFGPGWGRGFMPYQYGGHFPETGMDIGAAHRAWAAASGGYPDVWTQSSYPWGGSPMSDIG